MLSSSQGGEIAKLRGQLATTEDALYDAQEELRRQAREHDHYVKHLEAQSPSSDQDLQTAYEEVLLRAETEKSRADDLTHRLDAFSIEVDRVKLSEIRLKEEVSALRSRSASDEMARTELEREVSRLEVDKELLNVALESKQTELALATRKTAKVPSTPSTTSSRTLYSSTSRPRSAMDVTPIARPPATAAATFKASRRESGIVAQSPFAARPAPLASSTRHNRTPEKQKMGTAKIVISTSVTKPKARTSGVAPSQSGLSRRSSLPVLRRPTSVTGGIKRSADLKEEDEDAFM